MNILIVEDEARIAKRIERMTREFFTNTLHSLHRVEALPEALEFIKNNSLDIVLLDLNLNGESGFDILGTAVSESFHTVIISANSEQAISAFEYGVLDFVPKPFSKDRLEQAFNRVLSKEKTETHKIKLLAVKKKGRIQLISIEDILFIKGAGAYTELFLTNEKKELHDKSLEKLEQLLPETFERIHKSYLVKISEIKEIIVKSGSKYIAELKNGELIPIGRTKYKDIKAKWL
ncbi:LytTR family two component transcriptional regulator [Aquimarina sp. MAR_2010_214]|uniref:LytR/AlgR family response regulator transcription factor n=1 Tax=Aquimarina sp. MAR_2010_214 TaxID=1250026 RepID=UPI000C709451|nr:LytTR family DNA-binding domain-containing protein [Aquimarina sp. MAR_2010_214]PKV51289.1 LytTR family two component transcriptional regulator [Aquimarina sp. MAR_2010_214]